MKKNYQVKGFRTDRESYDLVGLICKKTGFPRVKINRWLYNGAIQKFKADVAKAGGIDNLQFDIKEIRRINQ